MPRSGYYAKTDQEIKKVYVDYIKEKGSMPTQQYVADTLGITRKTVNKHLNNIELSELTQPFKLFGNDVLMGLRNRAAKGDAKAAKLFFMLVYDWNEKQDHTVKHEGDIQIVFEEIPKRVTQKSPDTP